MLAKFLYYLFDKMIENGEERRVDMPFSSLIDNCDEYYDDESSLIKM